ncbi:phage/plasmid primase, P4 family [Streptomyces sp. NPDC006540]|uniref:DNA primase family protein n=1 Tax=Streptomyces sp. NPDC006540 TaxID=3155353 RepID=UPI0033B2B4CA
MQFPDILARFAEVTEEADGGYLALCPAHGDSRPSLRIWRGDNLQVRFTCRAGCDNDDVIAAVGLSWPDTYNASGEGQTVRRERPTLVRGEGMAALARYVDATLDAMSGDSDAATRAESYMAMRFGLDAGTAAELGIGVDYPGSGIDFRWRSPAFTAYPRMTVPLYDFDGAPHGLQGRDLSGECPGRWVGLKNPKGQRWGLYGVLRGQGGYGVTIVTEGPGDGLTACAVGYDVVIIRGAAIAANPDLMEEIANGLRGQLVVTAGDPDEAGKKFNRAVADGLGAFGLPVHSLDLSRGAGDLTAWREGDPQGFPFAFHAAVKAARPVVAESEPGSDHSSSVAAERTGSVSVSSDQGAEALELLKALTTRYGSSDTLNAHALVAWTDGRIKYAPGLGFHVWNGRVWEQDRGGTRVRQEIHRMGAALMLSGSEEGRKASKGFTMRTNIDNLMVELRSVPRVHVDAAEFDNRPDLLSFRNGTVDLRSGRMREHSKEDMLTYCLELDYDPDAQCPRWEQFLTEVFPTHPDLVGYVQRLTGYGITGHVAEQCFAVLWGKGANGKSVLTDTLTYVFRSITKTTPFATFEDKGNSGGIPNDIAALRGSRMVMASEGESGRPMSEAVLKRVTGKDMIAARFLRQEFFEFKPSFLLLLATNHKPKFRGQDEGLWRRVKMIPFTRWFAPEERDHTLDQKLMAEAQGIAAWAVRGAVAWFAGGLGDPEVITSAGKEYRETSDALAGFFPGVLERCDDGCAMSGADAFNAYLEWCEAENLPARERWTRRGFYDAMEERKVTRKKTAKGISLVGCRMADENKPKGHGIFNQEG